MDNKDLTTYLPRLLSGNELIEALQDIPVYDESIRNMDEATRLMQASDIYRLFVPSVMAIEIYNKLYLATAMALKKKNTKLTVEQRNNNYKAMQGKAEYRG